MNSIFKLSILLFLISNVVLGQEWVKTDIANFATIDFPTQSIIEKSPNETMYTANDSIAVYVVNSKKIDEKIIAQLTIDQIPKLYEGVVDGTLSASNAKLTSKKEFIVNKIEGIEIEYVSSSNPSLPSQRFTRIIYTNQHLLIINFWAYNANNNLADKIKEKYFNSFSLNLDKIDNTQQNSASDKQSEHIVSKIGYKVGQGLAYLMIIGVILGIVFLIRYFLKRIKKNNSTTNHLAEGNQKKIEKNICNKCQTENNSVSKYCKQCGFEL